MFLIGSGVGPTEGGGGEMVRRAGEWTPHVRFSALPGVRSRFRPAMYVEGLRPVAWRKEVVKAVCVRVMVCDKQNHKRACRASFGRSLLGGESGRGRPVVLKVKRKCAWARKVGRARAVELPACLVRVRRRQIAFIYIFTCTKQVTSPLVVFPIFSSFSCFFLMNKSNQQQQQRHAHKLV